MRVLFDTNVVLDQLLAREPHAAAAESLMSLVDSGRIEGLVCSTSATTVDYLLSKALGPAASRTHLRTLLTIFDVATVDREVLRSALDLGFADFEDAVIHEAARAASASAIVTRDATGFARASLPVFAPGELLAALMAESE